ncbi:hypothetical protein G7076_04905 [Sphingomonas sp. HDW15A]|uniref:hypothetical protein n=1 Tax=Sphingomonas sp. HDW15A TaxID=2714942 RepID=UPI00140DD3DC|nr:hypothetical protein [Sphingomonas sp. HDW15A]QIK95894.1 hypothetical protein G7076_04905 [Sphingomonas sp. HDW15A]
MRTTLAILASASLAVSAAPALAGNNNGLVVVDLTNADVLNNLAQNLKVNVSDISALNNVSVPIGLAAAICDVNANVLAAQKKTEAPTCTAKNNTSALQTAVQKKLGTVSQ